MGFIVPAITFVAENAAVIGAGIAGYGAYQQGQSAKSQAETEQEILEQNAKDKIKEAEEKREAARKEAQRFAREGRRLRGGQRVAIARAGVLATEGTPAFVLEETASELEADRLEILRQGFLSAEYAESEAFGMRYRGRAAVARGKNIKTGSTLTAGGTLLTGLGDAYYKKKQLE